MPRGREGEAAAAVRELGQPCVLVVDYAETRDGLGALLGEVAGWEGPDLRIVLLARGSGEWWQRLATNAEDRVARLLGAPPVTLGPLSPPGGQAELFSEALTAFAGKLGIARPRPGWCWTGRSRWCWWCMRRPCWPCSTTTVAAVSPVIG